MNPISTALPRPVLGDALPGTRARDAALIAAGVLFVTVAGQIAIPLPFSPVPLSLATFAVLITGATLGPARAAGSIGLYLIIGISGAPIFAQHGMGWQFASFGYIIGYLPAAICLGYFARRGADRSRLQTIAASIASSALIYAAGVPWLIIFLHVDLATGLSLGLVPFLIGDAIKAVSAALLLPSAWKLGVIQRSADKDGS